MNCRENYSRGHFPEFTDKFDYINKTYNVIVYEFSEPYTHFASFTSDALGMMGEGESIEESLEDLRLLMESVIEERLGGIYSDTSSFEFQIEDVKRLEDGWIEDDIDIVNRTFHTITIFSSQNE